MTKQTKHFLNLSAWLLFSILSGCGDSGRVPVYPTTGKVTLDGTAAVGASITFLPLNEKTEIAGFHPTGKTNVEGVFQLTTYDRNDGAPAAEYAVLIGWPAPTRFTKKGEIPAEWEVIDEYYGDPENPRFKATVTSDENPILQFDLKTPAFAEDGEDENE